MKVIKKVLKLKKKDYYTKHLLIINPLLPKQLTPKEAEVLATFMSLEGDLSKVPFSTTGRRIVRERLGISAGGLGNYLDQLKEKGFILENNTELSILPILIPNSKEQLYQFKLVEDDI